MTHPIELTEPETGRKLVNIVRACELTGASRMTIYRWLWTGKVHFIYGAGGRRLIYADTLFRKTPPPQLCDTD